MNNNIFEKLYTEIEQEVLKEGQDLDTIRQLITIASKFNQDAIRKFSSNVEILNKSKELSKIIMRMNSEDDPSTLTRIANYVSLLMTEIKDLSKRGSMNKNPTMLDKFLTEYNSHLELARELFNQ